MMHCLKFGWRKIQLGQIHIKRGQKKNCMIVIKDLFNLQNLIADAKFKKIKSELSSKLATFMKQQNDKD